MGSIFPITSGAGSSTSVPSMMAGYEIGSDDNIDAIRSTIFPSYSESTGAIGVQSMPPAVIPLMVAPQTGPPVVKKPGKMQPGGSNTPRYGSSEISNLLALSSSRNLCSREWCLNNPAGTTAEFKQYFNNLPALELKVYATHILNAFFNLPTYSGGMKSSQHKRNSVWHQSSGCVNVCVLISSRLFI